MKGIIFDIKEFAINDGPGIRTTVFMKGCPLRCKWCHNPEGLMPTIQQIASEGGIRTIGREYEVKALAEVLLKNADVFFDTGGGITFSGGEPLMQADFLSEVIDYLQDTHILLDTSGYSDTLVFKDVVSKVQHVYYDLKIIDSETHLRWTGKSNEKILQNLITLDAMNIAYTIRVPLVPSVTDTQENLLNIIDIVRSLSRPQALHLLSYNTLAGAKYRSVGMEYEMKVDDRAVHKEFSNNLFSSLKIPIQYLTETGTKRNKAE